jgi:acetyl esterase/lipase
MIVGSPQFEAAGSGRLARELDAVVVSPDYRLAPENPFPAALDDCMATLQWMRSNAIELGIDQDRITVMGASAGGGLAAAVAQRSHDEGITLRAQVLVYPMLDDRSTLTADHAGRGRLGWTPSSNRFGWTSYLGRAPRLSDRSMRHRCGGPSCRACLRPGSESENSICSIPRASNTQATSRRQELRARWSPFPACITARTESRQRRSRCRTFGAA